MNFAMCVIELFSALYFAEFVQDACYGGYVNINCFGLKIKIVQELFGRHPAEKCRPTPDGTDCSVQDDFYMKRCNGKQSCDHFGVEWRLLNTTTCREVYTNYVHLVYKCVSDISKYTE